MFSRTLMGLSAGVALCIAAPSLASTTETIQFGPPYNANLGPSHTFTTTSFGSFTANGYACNVSSCSAADIWRKNNGLGEQGLGMSDDPDHEIWWTSDDDYSLIELDVTSLFATATSATFSANSTTKGEMWLLFGSDTAGDGVNGTFLSYGQDEATQHALDGWGSYDYYSLISYGTLPLGTDPTTYTGTTDHTYGNILLSSLSLTSSVPEPGTWGMMLLGFGAVGFAMRRKNSTKNWIAQVV
jgi:PEP-CTERM motif-containing protein